MAIQRLEEVPAVCDNKACTNYRAFELVDVTEIQENPDGTGYIVCPECKQKITVE